MHDKRIWAHAALRRRTPAVAAFCRDGAKRRRPGQRKNIEIKLARIILARRLAERVRKQSNNGGARKGQTSNQTGHLQPLTKPANLAGRSAAVPCPRLTPKALSTLSRCRLGQALQISAQIEQIKNIIRRSGPGDSLPGGPAVLTCRSRNGTKVRSSHIFEDPRGC